MKNIILAIASFFVAVVLLSQVAFAEDDTKFDGPRNDPSINTLPGDQAKTQDNKMAVGQAPSYTKAAAKTPGTEGYCPNCNPQDAPAEAMAMDRNAHVYSSPDETGAPAAKKGTTSKSAR
jgi:hypothetical protein